MLTSWHIKNFKAWQDSGPIKLAPLTVIFGENSAGKSSLGQLLLTLKQTAVSSSTQHALDFGDAQSLIDLGSFAQNLHQGQLKQPLAFDLQWRLPEPLTLVKVGALEQVLVDELRLQVSILADPAQQPTVQSICYTAYQQTQVLFKLRYDSTDPTALQLQTQHPSAQNYNITVDPSLSPLRFYQLPACKDWTAHYVAALVQQAEMVFAGMQSLAALRAAPQRRYPWTGETPQSVGRAGESTAAAILAATAQQRRLQFSAEQAEQPFVQAIAYWLKQMGVASDFSIRPAPDNDEQYQLLLKSHADACEVNIADLGFGVSQLLPVLVQAFYAEPNSTVWLEQPEIHLHSQVQAGLADMLIAATQAKQNGQARNVQIIVESHSEHFLNRLQRRIAEGVISHEDVALYFCSRDGTQAKIEALTVDTYGEIANWPEHLFGDEMTDIAARAMAAVQRKRQHNN